MGFEHGMSRRTLVTLAVCLLAMPELVGARPRAPAPPRGPARTGAARPSTPAPPSTDAPPRVAAKASLRYLGLGADHVGPSAQLGGDGEDDVVFELGIQSPVPRELSAISLQRCSSRGVGSAGRAWSYPSDGHWALGVLVGSRLLKPGPNAPLDRVSTESSYQLHAAPPRTGFQPMQAYCAYAIFSDGTAAWAGAIIPPPVAVKLSFVGMEQDQVGRGQVATADGTVDAHFRLELDTGAREVTITSLVLAQIEADGQAIGGKVWDTRPNKLPILGVVRDGIRLNPKGSDIRDRVRGKVRYSLFISPWSPLINGTLYKVVVRHGGELAVSMTALMHSQLATPRPTEVPLARAALREHSLDVTMSYHGIREDQVGAGRIDRADGLPDAKFQLRIDPRGRSVRVNRMELSVSDAKGVTWRKTWDTRAASNWPLAVAIGAERLDARLRTGVLLLTVPITLNLWASEDFWENAQGQRISYFSKGAFFTVRLFLEKHPMVQRTIRLP